MIYLITLKLILRSWWRNKMFFLISLLSLTVGIACTNLLITFVIHETNIEQGNPEKEHIFCLRQDDPMNSEIKTLFIAENIPQQLKDKYAEVEEYVRLQGSSMRFCKHGENTFENIDLLYVDSTFQHFFPFQVVTGSLSDVLRKPGKIALSESTAQRIFGAKNPIGEQLAFESDGEKPKVFEVGAIVKDRRQSFVHFDVIASAKNGSFYGGTTLLKLKPGTSLAQLTDKIKSDKIPTLLNDVGSYDIVGIQDIYFANKKQKTSAFGIQRRDVQILSIGLFSAILVLIIACFNYANLGLSRILQQIRSMQVEKLMGATLHDIRRQLFFDTFLTVLLAFLLSLLLVNDTLPSFNQLMDSRLTFSFFFDWQALPIILLFILLLACIPSFFISQRLSRMSLSDYKNAYTGRKKRYLVSMLVVVQFIISIGLVYSTFLANGQFNLVKEKGEHYRNTIEIGTMFGEATAPLKQKLKQIPSIHSMSVSGGSLLDSWIRSIEIKKQDGSVTASSLLQVFSDYDFLKTMNIKQIKGHAPEELVNRYAYPVLVNECYINLLVPEGQDPIGHYLKEYDAYADSIFVIGGVVEDFHINTVERAIVPAMLHFTPEGEAQKNFHYIQIRMDGKDNSHTIQEIRKIWEELNPDKTFVYMDVYQEFLKRNNSIITMCEVLFIYSLISIILTCFGLFGISWYAVRQRIREIGIRKVHGAKTLQIIWTLNRPFLLQIFIAYVVALPVAYWLMQRWLEQFIYRASPSFWLFVSPLLIVLAVSVLAVTIHSWLTARTNPVYSLKVE